MWSSFQLHLALTNKWQPGSITRQQCYKISFALMCFKFIFPHLFNGSVSNTWVIFLNVKNSGKKINFVLRGNHLTQLGWLNGSKCNCPNHIHCTMVVSWSSLSLLCSIFLYSFLVLLIIVLHFTKILHQCERISHENSESCMLL